MKKSLLILAVCFSLALSGALPVFADEASDTQEAQLAANEVDQEAQDDEGRGRVVEKLRNEFQVEESVINDLRSRDMGYGEVGIALSLAKQMPGGITDENIQKVMDLRQGESKMGCGNVAKELDLNVGKAVSQNKKMANEAKAVRVKKSEQTQTQTEAQTQTQVNKPAKPQKPSSVGKPSGAPKNSRPSRPMGGKGKKG